MEYDVILIGQAGLGGGDPKLGMLILANFLRLLGEKDHLPGYIILWNEGVRLAQEGSDVLDHLTRLHDRGPKIISCRTCVEFFALEDRVAVGEIGSMPQIQEILFNHRVLTV